MILQWKTGDGGNGHAYALVLPASPAGSYTWTGAEAEAQSLEYGGSKGHLATVTSAGENDFLRANFGARLLGVQNPDGSWATRTCAWIGLTRAGGNLGWITGEPYSYTSWDSGEPNNLGGVENHVFTWTYDTNNKSPPIWNDSPNVGFNPARWTRGYFAEFDSPTAVPEPSTIASAGIAGPMGIGYAWRKRRMAKAA